MEFNHCLQQLKIFESKTDLNRADENAQIEKWKMIYS